MSSGKQACEWKGYDPLEKAALISKLIKFDDSLVEFSKNAWDLRYQICNGSPANIQYHFSKLSTLYDEMFSSLSEMGVYIEYLMNCKKKSNPNKGVLGKLS